MASHCHQRNEIYFFKILLERCLQWLRIPRKFTRKYGFNLSNPVFLKPPDGTEWKIYWTKQEDDIYLQNGWKEFVRYYSLEKGYLVMFKYEETSHFHVLLFDKTTLQIEYPSHASYHEKSNLEGQFSDDSVEILDVKPQKKQKIGTNRDFVRMPSLDTKKELEAEEMGGNAFTNKICPNSEPRTRMRRVTAAEKNEILKRVNAFRSENPFFIVIIQPSYVSNKGLLNIPLKFADEHLGKKQGTMILEVSEGRTWSAIYKGKNIHSGWHKFARDNNLKVGDACVFEMTNSVELTFKVLIYRVAEDPSCSFSQGEMNAQRANRALGKAEKFDSNNPFFRVSIRPSHLQRSKPYVPAAFYKMCTTEREKNILIQVGERSWHAKLIRYPCRSSAKLSAGWPAFARENNLQRGDICIFELINRDVLKAHIFRCRS